MKTNLERLEFELEEQNLVISNLHKTSEKLEQIKDDSQSEAVIQALKSSLKEFAREIEYAEFLKEEFEDSINFIKGNEESCGLTLNIDEEQRLDEIIDNQMEYDREVKNGLV